MSEGESLAAKGRELEFSQATPTPPPDAQAMTRHNYRECYQCTASRPRFCEVYYEQENASLIEQVKSALLDQSTPGGVKATYQQLLDVNTAQRETIRLLINTVTAERDRTKKAQAELNETWADERGTVWTRPTAWAYAQVCRVKDEQKETITRLEGERDGWKKQYEACHKLHLEAQEECEKANTFAYKLEAASLQARLTASEAAKKWTTARPTVAGFYWFRKGGKKRVVELEFESDGETLAAEGWRLIANYWNGEFQGPLTPGEE